MMIPKIREFDPINGVLVKDNIKGITSEDINERLSEIILNIQDLPQPWQEELITPQITETTNRFIADKSALEEILNRIKGEIEKLQQIHKGFEAFINANFSFTMGYLQLSRQYLE